MKTNILLLFLLPIIYINTINIDNKNSLGLPSGSKKNNKPLFFIERSKNKNRVYYDANYTVKGQIDYCKPIDVYWLNLEENYGKRGELSFIQEKFAFGYKAIKINDKAFDIKLKAFNKRTILLKIDENGNANAQISIKGIQAILNHIFIKAKDKGMSTTVEYIELFGTDLNKKTSLYEKIIP